MDIFNRLTDIADTLLGPEGCSWDKEQTLATLQPYLLEETHELLEAMDLEDADKIEEELGDCLYALIFIAKLAEQKNMFNLSDAIQNVSDKLIRRHPHVFGDIKVNSNEEIIKNWEEIKKKEGKASPISGIPPSLPALARAQKVILKLRRTETVEKKKAPSPPLALSEAAVAESIWEIVSQAALSGIDAESALRRYCLEKERAWAQKVSPR